MKLGIIIKNKIVGYRIDPELVDAYRSAIPDSIQLKIKQNGDSFLAVITGIEHSKLSDSVFLVTEAKTEEARVDMVNDLIFTYKNIPENYRPFYRQVLKPEGSVSSDQSLSLVKSV